MPAEIYPHLADRVTQRKLGHGEIFKDLMVDMRNIMRSLETLERIWENNTHALRMSAGSWMP